MTPTPVAPPVDVSLGWDDWLPLVGVLVTGLIALVGYALTQAWARRERWAASFAEALSAVEDYVEAPYRIRRRPHGDLVAQFSITNSISDIQSRIAFHAAWLRLQNPRVADAYDSLVAAARREAGVQMTEAWHAKAVRKGADVPLGTRYEHPETDSARAECVRVMREQLRLRWRLRDLRRV